MDVLLEPFKAPSVSTQRWNPALREFVTVIVTLSRPYLEMYDEIFISSHRWALVTEVRGSDVPAVIECFPPTRSLTTTLTDTSTRHRPPTSANCLALLRMQSRAHAEAGYGV